MKFCQLRKIARPPHEWRKAGLDKPDKRYRGRGAAEIEHCRGIVARFPSLNDAKKVKTWEIW